MCKFRLLTALKTKEALYLLSHLRPEGRSVNSLWSGLSGQSSMTWALPLCRGQRAAADSLQLLYWPLSDKLAENILAGQIQFPKSSHNAKGQKRLSEISNRVVIQQSYGFLCCCLIKYKNILSRFLLCIENIWKTTDCMHQAAQYFMYGYTPHPPWPQQPGQVCASCLDRKK